jgi:hypothetical protein
MTRLDISSLHYKTCCSPTLLRNKLVCRRSTWDICHLPATTVHFPKGEIYVLNNRLMINLVCRRRGSNTCYQCHISHRHRYWLTNLVNFVKGHECIDWKSWNLSTWTVGSSQKKLSNAIYHPVINTLLT